MFEVLTTVTFAEQNGKTKQTMRARVIKTTAQAAQYLAGMEAGWTQSLERLAESPAFFFVRPSSLCTTEAVRIRTMRPRIAKNGGLRQRGALRNTLMEKSLD